MNRKTVVCPLLFLLLFLLFIESVPAVAPATVTSPFRYYFSVSGVLEEVGSEIATSSPYWWLNSGGRMPISYGRGKTLQSELPFSSPWRLLYNLTNPIDTDEGYHPQNIFRLVGRSLWMNFTQEIYYRIIRNQLSESPNRNGSNGILLFNRYLDSDNLYYVGVRVDGTAIIKKKKNGIYYTLAQKKLFSGTYDRNTSPNLLPLNKWRGVRSVISTNANNSVKVDLYVDQGWTGVWTYIFSATDDGISYGGAALLNAGYGGLRTDFMDVEFDQYRIARL